MEKKKKRFWPILVLLLLAPFTGEVLSGSSPPAEYFQPITFLLLTLLYGVGALLVRETARRWKKGWLAILLMGMAYGIFEEGIMVRSFFDPTWGDLGLLATYGRWIGINWIWSISLTIFHAVVSIAIPIALTEMLFPAQKDTLWLNKRDFSIVIILFSLNALIGPFFGMKITSWGFLASALCIILLLLLAYSWMEEDDLEKYKATSQWKIVLAGFLSMVGLIVGMWILPSLSIPWGFTFLFLCILPWVSYTWYKKLGFWKWKPEECWSAIVGLLIPWLLLSGFSELQNAERPDDTSGMILVVIVFSVFLLVQRYLIYKRFRNENQESINQ